MPPYCEDASLFFIMRTALFRGVFFYEDTPIASVSFLATLQVFKDTWNDRVWLFIRRVSDIFVRPDLSIFRGSASQGIRNDRVGLYFTIRRMFDTLNAGVSSFRDAAYCLFAGTGISQTRAFHHFVHFLAIGRVSLSNAIHFMTFGSSFFATRPQDIRSGRVSQSIFGDSTRVDMSNATLSSFFLLSFLLQRAVLLLGVPNIRFRPFISALNDRF